ncbi:hypothetical protein GQ600_12891 [Phytophthora cactorum]|nr:hypothetical protein GQ600_12891 [Phytophthora cactorum]
MNEHYSFVKVPEYSSSRNTCASGIRRGGTTAVVTVSASPLFLFERKGGSELTTTISHVLVYSSLELASLIMAMMLLKRSLGFLPIRQLSFVLENQAGIIQAKLLILFIYVMQISLVHIGTDIFEFLVNLSILYKYSNARLAIVGADFSFKFAWLHDSKPSE